MGQPKTGRSKHPLYATWKAMIQRCEDPNCKSFKNYGARGISVWPGWRRNFEAFALAMGPKPTPKHSIDRIDNLKGYEPGNVRWATHSEQSANKRANRRLAEQVGGLILSEAARRAGIKRETMAARLNSGWDHKEALTRPLRKAIEVEFNGQVKTVEQWAKQTGIPGSVIHKRLNRKWPLARALTQPPDRQIQVRA